MASASLPRRLLGKLPATTFGPAFVTLGSNATIQAAAFVGSVLVARRYGVTVRGEYAGAAVWCALLSALSDFGISQAVPYRCARTKMEPGATIGTGLVFAAATGTLAALVGLVASITLLAPRDRHLALATAAFLPSIPLMLVGTYSAVAAQGLGLVRTYNAIRLVTSLATICGVAAALLFHMRTSAGIMGSIVVFQAIGATLGLFLLHRRTTAKSWRFDREELLHLWRFGIRTHLGNLAWIANSKLDQMIMSVALTTRELGFYSIAVSYAGLVFALASATTDSSFSRLAQEMPFDERLTRIKGAMRRYAKLSIGIGTALAILGFPFLPFAFGPEFNSSTVPAAILMVGGVLLGLNYTLGVGLRASGHPIVTSIAEFGGLLVTALGLPIALLRFGILATALISVTSYAATFLILLLYTRRFIRAARESAAVSPEGTPA